jgi:predicted  nucleic acid-binding Zn-ribbon protein
VQAELVALLAVQDDDAVIRELLRELAAFSPRLASLDKARQRAGEEVERTHTAIGRETERYRTLEARIRDHREKHERNVATLDQARKLREATAAMAQVELARRVLAEEESELAGMARRLGELQSALEAHRAALASLETEQAEARAAIAASIAEVTGRLEQARAVRVEKARAVSPSLLARYERIATRRQSPALYAIRGLTCAACDTSIPLQRRNSLLVGGAIDLCEGCGVLLYAAPAPAAEGTGSDGGTAA